MSVNVNFVRILALVTGGIKTTYFLRRIILLFVAGRVYLSPACFFHIIFINGSILGKKEFLNKKCMFWYLYNFV